MSKGSLHLLQLGSVVDSPNPSHWDDIHRPCYHWTALAHHKPAVCGSWPCVSSLGSASDLQSGDSWRCCIDYYSGTHLDPSSANRSRCSARAFDAGPRTGSEVAWGSCPLFAGRANYR